MIVILLISSLIGSVTSAVAQPDVPPGPHASGDGWAFTVLAAIVGTEFGEPLNWGPNDDGRKFLLVTVEVTNTTDDDEFINSNRFGIVYGDDLVVADDGLSKRPDPLGLPAMGDSIGDELGSGGTKVYILGWRLDGNLGEYVLDFGLGEANRLDLAPWIARDIDPTELIPDATNRPTPPPAATSAPAPASVATSTVTSEDDTPNVEASSTVVARPTFDAEYPADSHRDRIGGTGLQFVVIPSDVPAEVAVLAAGRGADGSWGAIVRNGSDDFVTGVSIAAIDADDDLGTADSVYPTFLEPDDIGIVVGSTDDTNEDREEGSVAAEVTESLDISEAVDEDSSSGNAGVSVISATIIDGDDGTDVLVTVENIGDDPIEPPVVGLLCFDDSGAIVGSLTHDFKETNSDDADFVEGKSEFTGTVPVGDLTCDAVLGGATATLYDAPEASKPTSTARPRPRSTAIAGPTATEASESDAITDDEQRYLDSIARDAEEIGEASLELSELFTDAGADITLLLDLDWNVDVTTQLSVFRDVYARAQMLAPSERQTATQALWLSITSLAAAAADDYQLGINTLDPALLESGGNKQAEATALIDDLLAEVEAFRDDPGSATDSSSGSGTIIGPVANCFAFATFEAAQAYYAAHPGEQPVIDPDFDGLACEVHFGVG